MPFRKQKSWGRIKPPAGYGLDYAHPLAQGMVAGFLFNEDDSRYARDITNNGWDLIAGYGGTSGTGVPSYKENIFNPYATGAPLPVVFPSAGKSIYFPTQSNNQVMKSVKTTKLLSATSPLTVIAMHNSTLHLGNMEIVSKWDADSSHGFTLTSASSSGQGLIMPNDNTDAEGLAAGFQQGLPVENQWFLLGASGAPLSIPTIYINGVKRALTTSSAGSGNHNDDSGFPLCVGGFEVFSSTGNKYYQGQIDFVYIYNRLLDAGEHKQIFNDPFCMIQKPKRRTISYVVPGLSLDHLSVANLVAEKQKIASLNGEV